MTWRLLVLQGILHFIHLPPLLKQPRSGVDIVEKELLPKQ